MAIVETREKEIGGCTYRVTQLDGDEGRSVVLRLARVVAAAFSSGSGIDLGRFWPEAKGVTLDVWAAISALSEADLTWLCQTMAKKTVVLVPDEGNTPKPVRLATVANAHFAGSRVLEQFAWLAFALEVTLGNGFFSGALDRAKAVQGQSPSASPPVQTGFSGASSPASA